ncbi:MAG: CHAT domain-containing protein [Gemmatimonadaceae bacterium]|nr:CHAT domain-containing protein [Gemmatimonadaceae bacterium]
MGTSVGEDGFARYSARVDKLQQDLVAAKRDGDIVNEIDTLLAIGDAALERDPALAMMHYRLAERQCRGEGPRLHAAIGGQGRVLRRGKQLPEAIEHFQRAVAAAERAGNRVAQVLWMVRRAAALRAGGDAEAGGALARKAEALLRSPSSTNGRRARLGAVNLFDAEQVTTLVELEGELGRDCAARGDEDGAEDHYRSAWSHAQSMQQWDAVDTWARNTGNACARRQRFGDALACYEAALAAARQLDGDDHVTATLRALASAYHGAARFEEGGARLEALAGELSGTAQLTALDESLSLYDQGLAAIDGIRVADRIAELGKGRPFAEQFARRVRETRAKLARLGTMPPNTDGPCALDLWLPHVMARAVDARDADGALVAAHLVCDVRLALALRGGREWARMIGGDVLQQAGLDLRVVSDTLALLVEMDRNDAASDLLQRWKAPAFCTATLHRLLEAPPAHPELGAVADAARALAQSVDAMAGVAQPDFIRAVNGVRRSALQLREAGERIRARDPLLHARLGFGVYPRDLVDALPIDGGVAIVDFLVGRDATDGVIYTRGADGVVTTLLHAPTFTAREARALTELQQAGNLSNALGGAQTEALLDIAKILHDHFFCFLARSLSERGVTQLILVPDVLTRAIPLHLAMVCGKEVAITGIDTSDANFLCEVMPVEYAPAVQAVAASQAFVRPRAIGAVAGFADPNGDLAGVRAELEAFGARATAGGHAARWSLATGAEMTREAVSEAIRTADLVVLGTHGHFVAGDLRASHLVMHDAPWSLDEMLRLPALEKRALLVLIACEAGAVALTPDDALSWGIPGALVNAGASAVLANLWPVVDVTANILLDRFLVHLAHRGFRPSAALFRAVRDLRRMTHDEAVAACRLHYDRLKAHKAAPEALVGARTLMDWVDDSDSPTPFAHPFFWGATAIFGSGWHLPAGACVGAMDRVVDNEMRLRSAVEAMRSGRMRDALDDATALAQRSDGVTRARAYVLMADSMLQGADLTAHARVSRRAGRLLAAAGRMARAEEDDELLEWINTLQRSLESDDVEPYER